MRVISVNVAQPRELEWQGRTQLTAISKSPVKGAVRITTLQVEGDRQANTQVHGGVTKAVYAYPSEHYVNWKRELPDVAFPWGALGENLTTDGLLEDDLTIGDTLRVGTALLRVTEPRLPCANLNFHFQRPDMVKRFHDSRTSGVYFAVVEEGVVEVGDAIEFVSRVEGGTPLFELARLHAYDRADWDAMERVVDDGFVPERWRERFREALEGRGD